MRKTVIAAAAALAVACGAMTIQASAADLDFIQPAPPPFIPTWSGFYVGGHLGYGEGTSDFRVDLDFTVPQEPDLDESHTFRSSLSPNGWLGGVQGGYNWQINRLVLGIEGDVSFTDWSDSAVIFDEALDGFGEDADAVGTVSADIDMLASVRGRIGLALGSVLIYGTGGVAWADATARGRVELFDDDGVETLGTAKKSLNDMGWVVGGGLGWMVIPQTVSVGVEGLYYFFDERKVLFETVEPIDVGRFDVEGFATAELHNAWVVRGRLDFHF